MSTSVNERQRQQTGLDEPTRPTEGKLIKVSIYPVNPIVLCIMCGYEWDKASIPSSPCPVCGHEYQQGYPIRKL